MDYEALWIQSGSGSDDTCGGRLVRDGCGRQTQAGLQGEEADPEVDGRSWRGYEDILEGLTTEDFEMIGLEPKAAQDHV